MGAKFKEAVENSIIKTKISVYAIFKKNQN